MKCFICHQNEISQGQVICTDCLAGYTGNIPSARNCEIFKALQTTDFGKNTAGELSQELGISRARVYEIKLQVADFIEERATNMGADGLNEPAPKDFTLPSFYISQEQKEALEAQKNRLGVRNPTIIRAGITKLESEYITGGVNGIKTLLKENQFDGPFPIRFYSCKISETHYQALETLKAVANVSHSDLMRLALNLATYY